MMMPLLWQCGFIRTNHYKALCLNIRFFICYGPLNLCICTCKLSYYQSIMKRKRNEKKLFTCAVYWHLDITYTYWQKIFSLCRLWIKSDIHIFSFYRIGLRFSVKVFYKTSIYIHMSNNSLIVYFISWEWSLEKYTVVRKWMVTMMLLIFYMEEQGKW